MKYILKRVKISSLIAVLALTFFSSCNKEPYVPLNDPSPIQQPTPTLATLLDDPTFSIFKAAVVKAGLLSTLQQTSLRFTMFIPNDAAMTASGLSLAVINALPASSVTPLVSYHILPQQLNSGSIPTFFPNFAYPTIYNPVPTINPLVRLTTSPSNRNGFWLNNVPIVQTDIPAVNGVAHRIALATAPPSRYIWDRINTDADMTIFKAAVQRADSGVAATSSASLI
ncbi:MAG TPA: fasciclin domain-containing protein, partial [Ferruginibacter sp.]|nr:fasciclin domain-containing protein [Ferruginibacter sp.]